MSTRDLCERLVADYDVDVTVFTTNALTIANFNDGSLPTLPIEADEEQNGVKIKRFPVVTGWAAVLKQMQRIAWHLKLPGNCRLRTWYQRPDFAADAACGAELRGRTSSAPRRSRSTT